jgi:septum formation protein
VPPDLDDGDLIGHVTPLRWAMAMAWFKAARIAWLRSRSQGSGVVQKDPARQHPGSGSSITVILAADTVCDLDGRIVGKPRHGRECGEILRAFAGRAHQVHTGFCLLVQDSPQGPPQRWIGADSAVVHLGPLAADEVTRYVNSGAWVGKAGGYSFEERLEAGWPLRCDGDPSTVMGLPLTLLGPTLVALAGGGTVSKSPPSAQPQRPSPWPQHVDGQS